jgi:hypothetical protein
MDYLIQEHKPKFDAWIKVLLLVPVCMPLIAFIALFSSGSPDAPETLIVFAFIILVIWLIMPRRFIIMEDRLKLVMGASLAINIPYHNIKELRKPSTVDLGVNFITSLKTPVEIVVHKGMNISIAPDDREAFINDINRAMQKWRRANNIND